MILRHAFVGLLVFSSTVRAQQNNIDSLMNEVTQTEAIAKAEPVKIFRATRVSNGHSVEMLPAHVLDMKIQHRFGYMRGGFNSFFGLDDATIRIGADYGVTNKFTIGFGRASYEKQWDCFAKYKILEQTSGGVKNSPLSLAVMASAMIQSMSSPAGQSMKTRFRDRGFYAAQVLLARRFGKALSLQLMPTIVHYNLVPLETDPNDILSMGGVASIRLSRSTSIVLEYYYNIPGHKFDNTHNALSIGLDIETAGHVFQLLLTNGDGVAERPFITETTGNFFDGDIRLGFNVTRLFQPGHRKKKS